ncbi:hypothetical protein D3C78_1262770 [compost metagenome]
MGDDIAVAYGGQRDDCPIDRRRQAGKPAATALYRIHQTAKHAQHHGDKAKKHCQLMARQLDAAPNHAHFAHVTQQFQYPQYPQYPQDTQQHHKFHRHMREQPDDVQRQYRQQIDHAEKAQGIVLLTRRTPQA